MKPLKSYTLLEAVLTQLAQQYADKEQLLPVAKLCWGHVEEYYRSVEGRGEEIANKLLALHHHLPELLAKQDDFFAGHLVRVLSCWYWRDDPVLRRLRVWLSERWGKANPETVSAARDWLGVQTGLDADLIDQLSLARVLEAIQSTNPPPPPPEDGKAKQRKRPRKKKEYIRWHGGRRYSIGEHDERTLTETEHSVLFAFLADPPQPTMDKPTLCKRSVEHAPKVLAALKTKYDGMFADAIRTPQGMKANGGYSVRIKHAVTQRHQSRT
jgi:hypothetical protein